MENTNLEKLKNLVVADDSNILEELKWRQSNRAWLEKSAEIGLKVLRILRERKMSQTDLGKIMGLSPQYVSKIVKGTENLSLETITKIEIALRIQLINIGFVEIPAEKMYTGLITFNYALANNKAVVNPKVAPEKTSNSEKPIFAQVA